MKSIKRKLLSLAITAAIFAGGAAALQAFSGHVVVTNNTGYTIMYLYVSHVDSGSWEEDVLGTNILQNGQSFRVNLNNYPSPFFDIKAVDEDGDSYTVRRLNVQTNDLTLTLGHLD